MDTIIGKVSEGQRSSERRARAKLEQADRRRKARSRQRAIESRRGGSRESVHGTPLSAGVSCAAGILAGEWHSCYAGEASQNCNKDPPSLDVELPVTFPIEGLPSESTPGLCYPRENALCTVQADALCCYMCYAIDSIRAHATRLFVQCPRRPCIDATFLMTGSERD